MLWGLPFAAASLDLITCRVAAHHFGDFAAALDEARRALRPGGSLVMADSIAPEDDAVADWMNDIEFRRDFHTVAPAVKEAFQVGDVEEDGDFPFSWPCWIFRAVKG